MKCAGMLCTVRAGVTKSKGWLAASRTGLDRKDNVRSSSRAGLTVFAGFSIKAGVGQAQPLDWMSANDVRFDDLVYVGFGNVPVPDGFWIHNDCRTVLALIQTAGLIRPHFALQAALRELLLECLLQLRFARLDRSIRADCPADAGSRRRRYASRISASEDQYLKKPEPRRTRSLTKGNAQPRFTS